MLFTYNGQIGIYHCPADRSTLTGANDGLGDPSGRSLGPPRARSYTMSLSLNGFPDYNPWVFTNIAMFKKLTEIKTPNTDSCLVFIDVHDPMKGPTGVASSSG
jgi:hypothetical protein